MKNTVHDVLQRARANTPGWMKTVYRVTRSSSVYPAPVAVPPDLVTECRVFADRLHMLTALPADAVVAEVGTQAGHFARAILGHTRPRALHLVDISWSAFDARGLDVPQVHRHTGLSHEVLAAFPSSMFDWIYVDADHSFDGVARDIAAAKSKVRPGGFLVFNDFALIDPNFGRYGVYAAVTRFVAEARWPLSHLALSGDGLYDVAIRRPA